MTAKSPVSQITNVPPSFATKTLGIGETLGLIESLVQKI